MVFTKNWLRGYLGLLHATAYPIRTVSITIKFIRMKADLDQGNEQGED
jgi:hypothetical protein